MKNDVHVSYLDQSEAVRARFERLKQREVVLEVKGLGKTYSSHQGEVTALKERAMGDFVNLEADMLGKYVDQFTAARQTNSKSSTGDPSAERKRALN